MVDYTIQVASSTTHMYHVCGRPAASWAREWRTNKLFQTIRAHHQQIKVVPFKRRHVAHVCSQSQGLYIYNRLESPLDIINLIGPQECWTRLHCSVLEPIDELYRLPSSHKTHKINQETSYVFLKKKSDELR
jgi:hypothetical protein